jgi:hypothetical protein
MLRRIVAAVALSLAAVLPAAAGERLPVVVELFTSQGCNSCPPADALLAELARRPDVLPLSFHVDYWDYLGWKDPYASRAHTERQRAYSRALATRFTYTPQMVVQGAMQEVGSKRTEVEALIAKAAAKRAEGPEIVLADGRVRIGAAAGAPASVWVAYFRRAAANDVPRGENAGRRLETVNAVRELRLLGGWEGKPVELGLGGAPPAGCDGGAILVLRAGPGPILAAHVFDAAR